MGRIIAGAKLRGKSKEEEVKINGRVNGPTQAKRRLEWATRPTLANGWRNVGHPATCQLLPHIRQKMADVG
jgi:hypothetical protein